jgi:hypothetical protein
VTGQKGSGQRMSHTYHGGGGVVATGLNAKHEEAPAGRGSHGGHGGEGAGSRRG